MCRLASKRARRGGSGAAFKPGAEDADSDPGARGGPAGRHAMSQADVRASWIAAAFLLLTLGSLVALAARAPSAAASDAQVAMQEGLTCQMDAPSEPLAPSVDALMQQVIEQRVRSGEDQPGDYVVLNNRGYNYGPAPGIDFDALMRDLALESAASR
jgi:hypothetical protein